MHVQSSCYAHKTDCFLTLLSSSSLKVLRRRRWWWWRWRWHRRDDNGDDGDKTFSRPLQIILKHCGARKEANTEPTNESPLTAFSLLLSPTRQASTARSPQRDNSEAPVNLVLPQDLPIDLRVKIVVCLIYLRQLDLVKVMVARAWVRVILAGKRGSLCHPTTSFRMSRMS